MEVQGLSIKDANSKSSNSSESRPPVSPSPPKLLPRKCDIVVEFLADLLNYTCAYPRLDILLDKAKIKIKKLFEADNVTFYFVDSSKRFLLADGICRRESIELKLNSPKSPQHIDPSKFRIPIGQGIIGNVAKTKKSIYLRNTSPKSHPSYDSEVDDYGLVQPMCLLACPITTKNPLEDESLLVGVAVIFNQDGNTEFSDRDQKQFTSILNGLAAMLNNSMHMAITNHHNKELSLHGKVTGEYGIVEFTNVVFGEADANEIGKQVATFITHNINAETASVFLLDRKTMELTPTIRDCAESFNQFPVSKLKKIAEEVIKTGKVINIPELSKDPCFSKLLNTAKIGKVAYLKIDTEKLTPAKSVLAVPIICSDKSLVGAVIIVNKIDMLNSNIIPFSRADEDIVATFCVLCGLALKKQEIVDQLHKQLDLRSEIFQYHGMAHKEEVADFITKEVTLIPNTATLDEIRKATFDSHIYNYSDERLCIVFKSMFHDLDYSKKYMVGDQMLIPYVLTVRKNYRSVPYHNFAHSVSVSHGIYILIKHCELTNLFTDAELYTMLFASFNHDIDHRGTNNQFQIKAETTLASIYTTSIMERHHFHHAVDILGLAGHQIFHAFSPKNYKECLKVFEHAIISTDLSLYLKNRDTFKNIIDQGKFNINDQSHREYAMGLCMTCVDLISFSKPWPNHNKLASLIYEEFFRQGDEEQRLGLNLSSSTMDRTKASEIPNMQIAFIDYIVLPAFNLLSKILPKTKFLESAILENKAQWKNIVARQ